MTDTDSGVSALRMSVAVTTPAPRETWWEIIAEDPESVPTQSPEWVEALCRTGKYVDASRLYQVADGRRVLLPLVKRTHTTAGRHQPQRRASTGPGTSSLLSAPRRLSKVSWA